MPSIEHSVLFHDPLSAPQSPDRPTKSFPGRQRGTPAADGPAPAGVSRRPQAVAEVLKDLRALQSSCLVQGRSAPPEDSGESPAAGAKFRRGTACFD
jgi:hypothetical protein